MLIQYSLALINQKKEPDSELVEKVKVETPIETTKESAQAFLDLAKEQGKVTENE